MSARAVEARREAEALGALGLARRAGRAAVGTRAVREAARAGRVRAVVLAGDASPGARRRVEKGLQDGTPIVSLADRERLGRAVGRETVTVVAVTDAGLAARVTAAAAAGPR